MKEYIRFDWAMKRLLRDKANHEIIEGLLESLLGKKYFIEEFLESEGNQEWELDKYNRVDILAKDTEGRLYIFEIQNNYETYYFHRMLYGVSKVISQYIQKGEPYSKVRKVYSINIVYFDLGQGEDYVYHGYTEFEGIHKNDKLIPDRHLMKSLFGSADIGQDTSKIAAENYILLPRNLNHKPTNHLEEWIRYLGQMEVSEQTTAPGLQDMRGKMSYNDMPEDEKRQYHAMLSALQNSNSVLSSNWELAVFKTTERLALMMLAKGINLKTVAEITGWTEKEIAYLQTR